AARRWFGWSAGKLLVIDIGGGTLEIAYGMDEEPDAAVSLPLGAGRLTAAWLPRDPPDADEVRALRRNVRPQLPRTAGELTRAGRLTAAWLPGDPPDADEVRALRRHVRTEIARTVGEFSRFGRPDHVVATSKTFKQLARIGGAPASAEGLYVQRELKRQSLESW